MCRFIARAFTNQRAVLFLLLLVHGYLNCNARVIFLAVYHVLILNGAVGGTNANSEEK